MINRDTGELILADTTLSIGPSTTRESFLSSQQGASATELIRNEPWVSYKLVAKLQGSVETIAVLQFYESKLWQVELFWPLPDDLPENLSEEQEKRRKAYQDKWLKSMGLRKQDKFDWGAVHSMFDAKSCCALIYLTYALPSELPPKT